MRTDDWRAFTVYCLEDPGRSYIYVARSCVEAINMAAYYENLKAQRPTDIYPTRYGVAMEREGLTFWCRDDIYERVTKNGQGAFDD